MIIKFISPNNEMFQSNPLSVTEELWFSIENRMLLLWCRMNERNITELLRKMLSSFKNHSEEARKITEDLIGMVDKTMSLAKRVGNLQDATRYLDYDELSELIEQELNFKIDKEELDDTIRKILVKYNFPLDDDKVELVEKEILNKFDIEGFVNLRCILMRESDIEGVVNSIYEDVLFWKAILAEQKLVKSIREIESNFGEIKDKFIELFTEWLSKHEEGDINEKQK